MRVMVIGLRGFPGVQGGVEKHAEHLYPLLAQMGCQVEVVVRSPYVSRNPKSWQGVRFKRVWAIRIKSLEAIQHTFFAVLYAGFMRPDILHIHAIGPALMTPLARLLGLHVVVTHHGPDYDREKWGMIARGLLQLGEYCGMRFASHRIAISRVIRDLVLQKHNRDSTVIPNGIAVPVVPDSRDALDQYRLDPRRYVLLVSRIVPEKRHFDLIQAFVDAKLTGWKLVLVGGTDHPDDYSSSVFSMAEKTENVVVTGFQSGTTLQELYANAGIFVLPSSHEGFPIALLEALGYGIPILASDIAANLEVGLPKDCYFPLGDIPALARGLCRIAQNECTSTDPFDAKALIETQFSWKRVAEQTLAVYQHTLRK